MLSWGGYIEILYECKILHLWYLQLFVIIASNVQVKHTRKQHEILHAVGTVNQNRYCSCFLSFFLHGDKNCSGYVMCFCDSPYFIWTDCCFRKSVKHFYVHKLNSRVFFITKQSSSWCKELHEKWSYQWIAKLPAFMESSLEVILSLLSPDHGIKIVVFGAMLCSLSDMYQHFGGNRLPSYQPEDWGSRFNGTVGTYPWWQYTPSYLTGLYPVGYGFKCQLRLLTPWDLLD